MWRYKKAIPRASPAHSGLTSVFLKAALAAVSGAFETECAFVMAQKNCRASVDALDAADFYRATRHGIHSSLSQVGPVLQIRDQDAVEIGKLYQLAHGSLVASVKYSVECGQRLIQKKAGLKHGQWLPWLEANIETLGFNTLRTAQLLMKGAANTKLPS